MVAEWVARQHLNVDTWVREIWHLPKGAPVDEIRLLEVGDQRPDTAIEPMDFGLDLDGRTFKLLIADINSDQMEQIKTDASLLPVGWHMEGSQSWVGGQHDRNPAALSSRPARISSSLKCSARRRVFPIAALSTTYRWLLNFSVKGWPWKHGPQARSHRVFVGFLRRLAADRKAQKRLGYESQNENWRHLIRKSIPLAEKVESLAPARWG